MWGHKIGWKRNVSQKLVFKFFFLLFINYFKSCLLALLKRNPATLNAGRSRYWKWMDVKNKGLTRLSSSHCNFFFFLRWSWEAEPLPFAPILVALHFAPSGTESGQLVKGPASLKLTKLEGLTERIRIGTTGRSYQMHKKVTNESTLQQNW